LAQWYVNDSDEVDDGTDESDPRRKRSEWSTVAWGSPLAGLGPAICGPQDDYLQIADLSNVHSPVWMSDHVEPIGKYVTL
jgi:hypothetical protein